MRMAVRWHAGEKKFRVSAKINKHLHTFKRKGNTQINRQIQSHYKIKFKLIKSHVRYIYTCMYTSRIEVSTSGVHVRCNKVMHASGEPTYDTYIHTYAHHALKPARQAYTYDTTKSCMRQANPRTTSTLVNNHVTELNDT
jgi:hypothetical protein